jgi:DNA polymerase-3 subunit gamma/tau
VLSRCIKFNLKRLTPEQITGQMRHILGADGIAFDDEGIEVLARAADGSLRDGLSLLDQAIAHGGGALRAHEVHAMLGTVERAKVRALLDILANGDGAALLDEIERIAGFAPDFAQVLDELAGLLHRIQLLQLVPTAAAEDDAELLALSGRIGAPDVQLWYQMAVTGRRDLPLAPTPRVGFEMALLRMLAFAPAGLASSNATTTRAQPPSGVAFASPVARRAEAGALQPEKQAQERPHPPSAPRTESAAGASPSAQGKGLHEASPSAPIDWPDLIARAGLRGPVGQLAQQATLVAIEERVVRLALKPAHEHLAVPPMVTQLEQRLGATLGREVKVKFERDDGAAQSPAELRVRADHSRRQAAEAGVHGDPFVQSLVDTFGARVIPDSIRPIDS